MAGRATISGELTLGNSRALQTLRETQAAAKRYREEISKIQGAASLPLPDIARNNPNLRRRQQFGSPFGPEWEAGLRRGTDRLKLELERQAELYRRNNPTLRMEPPPLLRMQGSRALRAGTPGGGGGAGGRGGQGGGSGFSSPGMGLLMLSQTVDDAQYGLRGVVNNVAPLIMAFGGTAGLAGAVTVAAVGVNLLSQAWDKLNNKQELAKSNAESMEKYQENVAKSLQKAADAGNAYAQARSRLTQLEQLGAAFPREQAERLERVVALSDRLRRLDLERLPAAEKLRAIAEDTSRAEEEQNARELAAAQERVNLQRARMKESQDRLTAMRRELKDLEGNVGGATTNAQRQRMAFLTNAIPGEEDRLRTLGEDSSNSRALREAESRRDVELPKEREIRRREAENSIMDQKAGETSRAFLGIFDKINNAIQAADRIAQAYEQARLKAADQAKQQANLSSQLEIAEARSKGQRGKADRLQKAADLQSSTQKYLDAGYTPDEAASMAQREQDARTRRPGQIRGAGRNGAGPGGGGGGANGGGGRRSLLDEAKNAPSNLIGRGADPRPSLLDGQGFNTPSALDEYERDKRERPSIFTPRPQRPSRGGGAKGDATAADGQPGGASTAPQKADPAVTALLEDMKGGINKLVGLFGARNGGDGGSN